MEKCSLFITDENKLRTSFYDKLKKHFLHQLFVGLSDQVPKFCSENPQFDLNLPNVEVEYLRHLRKVIFCFEKHSTSYPPRATLLTPYPDSVRPLTSMYKCTAVVQVCEKTKKF